MEGAVDFAVLAFAEVACHCVVVYYFYHWGLTVFLIIIIRWERGFLFYFFVWVGESDGRREN